MIIVCLFLVRINGNMANGGLVNNGLADGGLANGSFLPEEDHSTAIFHVDEESGGEVNESEKKRKESKEAEWRSDPAGGERGPRGEKEEEENEEEDERCWRRIGVDRRVQSNFWSHGALYHWSKPIVV